MEFAVQLIFSRNLQSSVRLFLSSETGHADASGGWMQNFQIAKMLDYGLLWKVRTYTVPISSSESLIMLTSFDSYYSFHVSYTVLVIWLLPFLLWMPISIFKKLIITNKVPALKNVWSEKIISSWCSRSTTILTFHLFIFPWLNRLKF